MEQYLIQLGVFSRVEAEQNAVIRACTDAQQGKSILLLLGTKGSRRRLNFENVTKLGTTENYLSAAKQGLLYTLDTEAYAFAPAVDPTTGLPVLMEEFDEAFRKRSYAGNAEPPANVKSEPQQQLDMTGQG